MLVVDANLRPLIATLKGAPKAIKAALRKAGSTALRDMKSEASKRVRDRKRIKGKYVRDALVIGRPKGSNVSKWEWSVGLKGKPVPLIAYPHRQTKVPVGFKARLRKRKQGGVSVEVNRGKRTFIAGAFIATMASGHKGIYVRRGAARLPIRELLGSRPADALLHKGEAEGVLARGSKALASGFTRLLPLELAKLDAGKGGT